MKVYSDTLTRDDLLDALPRGVSLDSCSRIHNPRVRKQGWNVQLRRWGSNRHVNSGHYGAGEQGAASYDDHGQWMARLYDIDPDARISWWRNREDFSVGTQHKYDAVTAGGRA